MNIYGEAQTHCYNETAWYKNVTITSVKAYITIDIKDIIINAVVSQVTTHANFQLYEGMVMWTFLPLVLLSTTQPWLPLTYFKNTVR